MATSCVPLRSRSSYSLLTGTTPVEDLVKRAAKLGYGALALTDRNGIYGAVPFCEAAAAAGIRPIIGVEVTEDPPVGVDVADGARATARVLPGARQSIVLLARDRQGLASLGRIVTARHLDPGFDLVETVAREAKSLHVIADTLDLVARLREAGLADSLWLEATPRRGEGPLVAAAIADARRLGVRPIAGGRGSLIRGSDHLLHEVLVAIRENGMVGSVERVHLAGREDYLRAPWEMESVLAALPDDVREEALANALAVADSCRAEIREGYPILPHAPIEPGRDEMEMLRAQTLEGVQRRYGHGPDDRVLERLEHELQIIARLGFAGYFLIVGEIARFARQEGIPVVGRGSGASSIVAYVLDVTSVDPIAHDLVFERFLNERRPDFPDLDLDFCWKRRDEVIEHVYQTYGRDRVAMIATHVTYGPRSAFRDVARAFGVPLDRVNLLSRLLPHDVPDEEAVAGYPAAPVRSGARLSPVLTRVLASEVPLTTSPWPEILEATVALQGFPRHLGVHPGGIVIADRPLAEIVPLEEATKGIIVTQYEMRAAEAVGLVKIDLLANRALTECAETARLVRATGADAPDLSRIPEDDPATATLLEHGDTLGCFQIESPGMRNLLSQLGTTSLGGTIDAHSLIRPGPASSGVKEEFVRRTRERRIRRTAAGTPLGRAWAHAGLAAHAAERAGAGLRPHTTRPSFDLPHPELATLLTGTHGVMLYEEDVMRVAAWLVGSDLSEGDEIRRAIAGASEEELGGVGEFLIRRAMSLGLDAAVAEGVWNELKRFAAYTFCKAHAAGYGVLAYQTAYLKAHYPAPFAVSLMNHHQGMYPKHAHVADARRHGVEVRPPCVNRSSPEWTLEDGGMRVGLSELKGLHEKTLDAIVHARGGTHASLSLARSFESLADFLARVPLTRPEAESLILVGAFDFTGRPRPELVWELRTGKRERRREGNVVSLWESAGAGEMDACGDVIPVRAPRRRRAPALADFGPEDRLRHEWEFLEMALTMHPTETAWARELGVDTVHTADLRGGNAAEVSLLGIPIARRHISTSRGEHMMFLTLEDASGVAECTLFPPVYRRFAAAARSGGLMRVHGRIENQYGAVTLTVEVVEAFPMFTQKKDTGVQQHRQAS